MASGSPDWSPRIVSSGSSDEQLKISVTAIDTFSSFSQQVKSIVIHNDGKNAVHYKRDAAATTNNHKIPAKSWLTLDVPITTPHFICAAGETATVYVIGVF